MVLVTTPLPVAQASSGDQLIREGTASSSTHP